MPALITNNAKASLTKSTSGDQIKWLHCYARASTPSSVLILRDLDTPFRYGWS